MREYFCIELSNQVYLGLFLEHIDKLIHLHSKDTCIIPGVADFWLGVANYKSSLLWILDTEKFLNISQDNNQARLQKTALILNYSMGSTQKQLALVVQGLQGVIEIEKYQDQKSSSFISPILQKICDAVARHDDKDIYLVNTETLLMHLSQNSLLPA